LHFLETQFPVIIFVALLQKSNPLSLFAVIYSFITLLAAVEIVTRPEYITVNIPGVRAKQNAFIIFSTVGSC
jgi:hypothetical protein